MFSVLSEILFRKSSEGSLLKCAAVSQLDLVRTHHRAQDAADLPRGVEPGVVRALLHDEVAGLERLLLTAVEDEDYLASEYAEVVEAEGAMHGDAGLGLDVGDAEEHAAGAAARERLAKLGRGIEVVDGDGVAAVEDGKGAALGAEGGVGVERRVVGEDGETPLVVAVAYEARLRKLLGCHGCGGSGGGRHDV